MYRPTLAIWAVGEDQVLAGRAMAHMAEALTRIDLDYIRAHPRTPHPYDAGIVYKDDSRRVCDASGCRTIEDDWADVRTVIDKRYGDCDDLAPYLAAWYRARGILAVCLPRCYRCVRPGSRFRVCWRCQRPLASREQIWHMQVLVDGDPRRVRNRIAVPAGWHDVGIEDPSRVLGMPAHPDGDLAIVPPDYQIARAA